MTQRDLFNRFREPTIEPIAAPAEDRPRLRGQNAAILEALRQGPKSNRLLAVISLKYTSRISDLRKAGYDVRCEKLADGLTVYRLID